MDFSGDILGNGTAAGSEGGFLENGTNRLAKDLFLLTAVSALFILMFAGTPLRVRAKRSWDKEARMVEKRQSSGKKILNVHIRKDGKIKMTDNVASGPDGVRKVTEELIEEKPALKDARVVLHVWQDTPSIMTSNVSRALEDGGLSPENFNLRFTEE